MSTANKPNHPQSPPLPGRPDQLELGLEKWREAANRCSNAAVAQAAVGLLDDDRSRALLNAILGNSPFLTQCLLSDIAFSVDVVTKPPESSLQAAFETLERDAGTTADTAVLNKALRVARRRVALVTAAADLAGAWPLETVTATLSRFADRAVALATAHHLRRAGTNGTLTVDPDDPLGRSGVFILGLGKLGANELNYSSDIDIAVFYDPDRVSAPDPDRIRQTLVRLTQAVVASLQERTADGYVFRTDLRLRPDPNSTPLAISTLAAEAYYESMGQNWERAAMIKARVIAGDAEAGAEFLAMLRPFVWRRNLDFAAIQDVHSIKRQINAHHGGAAIAVAGHNLKLGRGGNREIEFFAQTQQLIFGGRAPE
ncbi:MAG: bifunctional [glutamine synthetase] adenylyltransferase/[glutamine synthetase]-adenylyl-L-tyrosine phosphorylase, partial [Bauldia litoralis]